ncbi:UvrD-helicase domain-containing protein [Halobacterium salinarum]|uniref:UvrD-helicase domain-containing protein n=1 Tax=Halobacterium salinarum TaxID=2242 RepID=UPI0025576C30|nr:UvrD-helicase domain-containing protein [Halobacterium salinarum]MDL0134059.1 UvrD-helicase domain-containing protein [Halobacterium salinarum]
MSWNDTQQWIEEEQETLLNRLPVVQRFVTSPDAETHKRLREEVSRTYDARMDASDTAFAECRRLHRDVLERSWIETDSEELIDPEALSEPDLTRVEQAITDLERALGEATGTRNDAPVEHLPPTDGPLWHAYLTRTEQSKIEEIKQQFAGIQSAADIADDIRTLQRTYLQLQQTLAPFTAYERYLTTDEKHRILDRLSTVEERVEQLRAQIDDPTPALAERFDEFQSELATDHEFVTHYNDGNGDIDGFVTREINRHSDLFSEYDEANHSLNTKQAQAVVRNNQANQVVAGPGTGKTVALTARIAYLIRGLGVDPDRIVALTFTNEATTEMADRLEEWFDITDVECSTLHAFGFGIATDYLDTPRDLIEEGDIRNFVRDRVSELRESDPEFRRHYAAFLRRMNNDLLDQSEFDSKEEFYEARTETQYTTLKDERVESRAEKAIADWLFAHGIEYRHEHLATWADTADDKGGYNPDFYLPEHNLYIEHWGIDENASVAPWFTWSSEEYLEKLRWARGQFADTDEYTLIDTYEFDHMADRLEAVLEHRLQVNGVPIERKSESQLIEDTYRYNDVEGRVYDKFLKFVQNAKRFNLDRSEIESNLTKEDPRQYHFGHCGARLYEDFLAYLDSNQLMVFSDMISTAATAVADPSTSYGEEYDHVLVDEFQDVSGTNVELLQELTRGDDGPRQFCVGDDWQSIYSFQGSEVEYFVNFDDYFDSSTQTTLTKNYRSPPEIVEAGKTLIDNNDRQLEKDLSAVADTQTTPRLHVLPDATDYQYKESVGQFAAERIQQYLANSDTAPEDVMVLCQLDNGAPYLDAVKSELRERTIPYDGKDDQYRPDTGPLSTIGYDDDGVAVFSIHQSKGKEAEHVIVLHATDGDDGIPLADRGNLLDPVKPIDTNSEAEARRLFYVAITRAEGTLDITTKRGHRSTFVEELQGDLSDVYQLDAVSEADDRVTVEATVTDSSEDTHESKRQEGVLADETGTRRFVIWDDTDFAPLSPGTRYRLSGAEISSFSGQLELHLTESTDVTPIGNTETSVETPDTVIEATVQTIFDDPPEAIQQKGYLWDGSEQLYVTTWASENPPTLHEDATYRFVNPQLDEWNGTTDLIVTSDTQIERIDSN